MKTVHRIYTWVVFPIVATVYIVMLLLTFVVHLLMSFCYDEFYNKIVLPETAPANMPVGAEYLYRLMMAIAGPVVAFWDSLKSLNDYKF